MGHRPPLASYRKNPSGEQKLPWWKFKRGPMLLRTLLLHGQ
jgi:hypothetical protein